MDKTKKRRIQILAASVFWLGVWQAAAAAIGQEVFLVSPVQAIGTLVELLPQAEFWQRIGFSAGRILLGFGLGALSSAVLAVAAEKWEWVDALLAPVMQLVKATPVASFIILALVWVSGSSLSVLISFLMVLPVLYSAVRTGIGSADRQLLEMAQVFRLAPGGAARVPAGVQRGAGHLLEERRSSRGHRPAGRQHRRRALPGKNYPFHRGAVCLDLRHHPAERRIRKAVPRSAG